MLIMKSTSALCFLFVVAMMHALAFTSFRSLNHLSLNKLAAKLHTISLRAIHSLQIG